MIYMIGVCRNRDMRIEGFRLFDTDTMKIMDATYGSVYDAITQGKIEIGNLEIEHTVNNNGLVEKGREMTWYPRIVRGKPDRGNKFVIVGVTSEEIVCTDVLGNVRKIKKDEIKKAISYGMILSNNYVLEEKSNIKNVVEIKSQDEDSKVAESINRIISKYKVLGLKPPFLENINGNITLVGVDWDIESINIQPPITHIGNYAFNQCRKLKEVNIGSSVRFIGIEAFKDCRSLYNINIPDNVSRLGIGVFSGSALRSIRINTRRIPDRAFEVCRCLERVEIGDRVREIGNKAFSCCNNLSSINIPDTVIEVGDAAFISSGLSNALIQSRIESIPNRLFGGCVNLESITIQNTVKSIGDGSFSNCIKLNEIKVKGESQVDRIHLPDMLESIGGFAFKGCTALREVNIPVNVKNISRDAFRDCINLIRVKLPDGLRNIGKNAFYGCPKLDNININMPANMEGIYGLSKQTI